MIALQCIFDNPLNKLNCPGDDGLIVTKNYEEDQKLRVLRLIGDFQMTKVYKTLYAGCLHLKRSIVQTHKTLGTYPNVVPPSFEHNHDDDEIDKRYIKQISRMTKVERQTASASAVLSFLKSLRSVDITPCDRLIIQSLLTFIYTMNKLPFGGSVPQFENTSQRYFCCIFPFENHDYSRCPIDYTIRHQYTRYSESPVRDVIEKNTDLRECKRGEKVRTNGTRMLNYLRDLGYVRSSVVTHMVLGEEVYNATVDEYTLDHRVCVYEYEIVKDIPYFLLSLDYMV